jgi:hypothetical protein
MLPIHIVAGSIALIAGWIALYALKGAQLHRRSGTVFVYAMLVMSSIGAIMAAIEPSKISVIGGVLAFYLVTTGLLTVRRGTHRAFRRVEIGAMLVAFAVSIASFALAVAAASSPTGRIDGLPPGPAIMFGIVGLVAGTLDARMLARGVEGVHRIARHLWRMCYALWIATMSFFLGQPDVFPEPLRHLIAVRAIPVVLLLLTMIYWLVRVLRKRGPGGSATARASQRTPTESRLNPRAHPATERTPARGTI